LVVPVAEIVKLARSRGVDVIVDAAHAWGQLDFDFPALDVDFAGFNLHKWMGAPLGVGFLYIRKSRIVDINRAYDDGDYRADDIRSRVHTGTTNIANVMTVPDALDLHCSIGPAAKAARLRHLRDRWVGQVRDLPKLQILTPDEPRLCGGITSVRLKGKTSREDNLRLAARLREEFGLFTVRRGGVAAGDCVRISPALFTSASEVDSLVHALRVVAA
jgi:selenocysteine lyase/cysteine desulfurase